jgi:predicted DNA-binding transcriptional regulator YafY
MTADDIRREIAGYNQDNYEAFRRAFERDKEALRAMGVPLELHRSDPLADQDDAYLIPKERYYLPDLDLEPDELAALSVASETVLGRGDEDAAAGLLKLSMQREPGGGAAGVVAANLGIAEAHLDDVYAALTERRPIEFTYEDAHGRRSARALEPWSLVHRGGHWYVVGKDRDAGEQRTFKLSRMRPPVRPLQGSYAVPEGFDAGRTVAADAWEFGPDEPAEVTVRFEPAVRWWAEQNLERLGSRAAPGGALDVDMPTGNVAALLGWVIGWHGLVSIRSPASLRRRVIEHLEPWLVGAPS